MTIILSMMELTTEMNICLRLTIEILQYTFLTFTDPFCPYSLNAFFVSDININENLNSDSFDKQFENFDLGRPTFKGLLVIRGTSS